MEKMMHKTKAAALQAARKTLGGEAIEGVDFNLKNTGAGWTHEGIPAPSGVAVRHKAAKAPKKAAAAKASKVAKPKKTAAPKAQKAPSTGSKTELLIGMMSKPGGATSAEMEKAAGWQPHSVRGLIGTLKKKGTVIVSKKLKGEATIYQIAKAAPPSAAAGAEEVI